MGRTGSRSPAELRALVRERDGDDCCICKQPIDFGRPAGTLMGASLEHVVPLAAGGTNDLPNLRLSHAFPCNHAKGGVHEGIDYAGAGSVREAARHERRMAAAVAQARAVLRKHEQQQPAGRKGAQRRLPAGPRQPRGPWGGLIVVEERGPWGGIVTANYASLGAASHCD